MEPITAITSAITSIKTATEIAQFLKTSDETFIKAEFKLKIAEIMEALADTKMSVVELKEIIHEKDNIIEKLNQKLQNMENNTNDLIFKDGAYYLQDGQGPFCTGCYDTKKIKVRLINMPLGFQDFGKFKCPSCGNMYQ